MFKEVTFSYNILSDPEKRRQFDSAGFEVRFVLHCGIVDLLWPLCVARVQLYVSFVELQLSGYISRGYDAV